MCQIENFQRLDKHDNKHLVFPLKLKQIPWRKRFRNVGECPMVANDFGIHYLAFCCEHIFWNMRKNQLVQDLISWKMIHVKFRIFTHFLRANLLGNICEKWNNHFRSDLFSYTLLCAPLKKPCSGLWAQGKWIRSDMKRNGLEVLDFVTFWELNEFHAGITFGELNEFHAGISFWVAFTTFLFKCYYLYLTKPKKVSPNAMYPTLLRIWLKSCTFPTGIEHKKL